MQKLIETLSTVSVGQALTGGVTVVALVSVFIEITPVKINPVSKFLAWLGRKINSEVIANACAMALKNLMGLVCDPVAGLVEVPCVKRNVGGAVNALAAADMALAGITSKIPVDQVIDAMKEVGDKMDVTLRETGVGGVAGTPAGQEVSERLNM